MNTAQGCGLKVACVSAAVSDESVAGDSGVYEASVQRWVPESGTLCLGTREWVEPRAAQVSGRGLHGRRATGRKGELRLHRAALYGAVPEMQTAQLLLALGAPRIWESPSSVIAVRKRSAQRAGAGERTAPLREGTASVGRQAHGEAEPTQTSLLEDPATASQRTLLLEDDFGPRSPQGSLSLFLSHIAFQTGCFRSCCF